MNSEAEMQGVIEKHLMKHLMQDLMTELWPELMQVLGDHGWGLESLNAEGHPDKVVARFEIYKRYAES